MESARFARSMALSYIPLLPLDGCGIASISESQVLSKQYLPYSRNFTALLEAPISIVISILRTSFNPPKEIQIAQIDGATCALVSNCARMSIGERMSGAVFSTVFGTVRLLLYKLRPKFVFVDSIGGVQLAWSRFGYNEIFGYSVL